MSVFSLQVSMLQGLQLSRLPLLHIIDHFQQSDTSTGELAYVPLSYFLLKKIAFEVALWQNANCQSDLVCDHGALISPPLTILPSKKGSLVTGYDISFFEVISISLSTKYFQVFPQ